MPTIEILAPEDARLAPYRDLKVSNSTRWAKRFVVEGDKLVRRLLESDFQVESLLVSRRQVAPIVARVPRDVDVLVVPDDWIERIVGFNFHRGLLACAHRKQPLDLLSMCLQHPKRLTCVVCPDVQNPENLGAILRISSAFGVDMLVLGAGCCDPFSRRVLRVSMGAALRLPVVEAPKLAADLTRARREHGLTLWATVAGGAADVFDQVSRPAKLALVFGSEGHGLDGQWLQLCDRQITIPMPGKIDSLNVAVAAGILLYHFTRSSESADPGSR